MSANSSNQKDDASPPSSTTSSATKFHCPLIDVDCNLIHSDLISLLPPPSSSSSSSSSDNQYFNILHHPSTKLSNIQGVFTPSSTIKEAEDFHTALIEYNDNVNENKNHDNVQIKMSIGIHPYHTNDDEISSSSSPLELNTIQDNIKQRIQTLLSRDEQYNFITCIGELGLDYSDGFPNNDIQRLWFEFQLQIAKEEIMKNNEKGKNLSLFIHERLAFHDTISFIDKVFPSSLSHEDNVPKIIIHCFTGTKEELQEYIRRDYYISLSGYILKNGDGPNEINQCLKDGIIPLNKLMIETDAPYMGFANCRETFYAVENEINQEFQLLKSKKKKSLVKSIYPNVPSALPKVLEHVANVLNEGRRERNEEELTMDFVASCLYENSKMFFGF
jgi:TatD DNase family protein